jgi:phosphatidylserine decarboxylase
VFSLAFTRQVLDGKKLVDPPQVQVSDADGLTITGVLTADEAQQVKDGT